MLKTIKPTFTRDKKENEPKTKASANVDQKFSGEFKYKSKSVGSKLLEDANEDIVKNYITPITKKATIICALLAEKRLKMLPSVGSLAP